MLFLKKEKEYNEISEEIETKKQEIKIQKEQLIENINSKIDNTKIKKVLYDKENKIYTTFFSKDFLIDIKNKDDKIKNNNGNKIININKIIKNMIFFILIFNFLICILYQKSPVFFSSILKNSIFYYFYYFILLFVIIILFWYYITDYNENIQKQKKEIEDEEVKKNLRIGIPLWIFYLFLINYISYYNNRNFIWQKYFWVFNIIMWWVLIWFIISIALYILE